MERHRFYYHLIENHSQSFKNEIFIYFIEKPLQNIQQISFMENMNVYIQNNILPKYLKHHKNPNLDKQIHDIFKQKSVIDLKTIDLDKINQVIIDHGIYGNQSKITSPEHSKFIAEFFKVGYEIKQL